MVTYSYFTAMKARESPRYRVARVVLGPIASAAPSETYAEYSMMTQRHAGQF